MVVQADASGDVCWDRTNQRWLAGDRYAKGWRVQEPPTGESAYVVRLRVPDQEALEKAVAAVGRFTSSTYVCGWCGVNDLRSHVIVPDIYGTPVIRCVLRPDPETVDSYGGGGEKKHWAYAVGACRSVRRDEVRSPGRSWGPLLGVSFYGEPLTTVEVTERRWCARCVDAAWNQRENRRRELEAAVGRPVTADELADFVTECNRHDSEAQLLEYLRAAADERDVTDVREALRVAWRPLTADAYVERRRRFGGSL